MAVVFVTCMHGNERMPSLALASAGIPHLIANPEAVRHNKRFIDVDLNASFGKPAENIETKRAEELLANIPEDATVIDFHSYDTDSGPFAILVDPALLPLARMAGIKRVLLMKFNVKKGHALINYRKGISVEVGNHNDPRGFDVALSVAMRVTDPSTVPLSMEDVELYEVYGEITEKGEYEEFTLHPDGFYPIFSPINQYNNYGLKARRVSTFS